MKFKSSAEKLYKNLIEESKEGEIVYYKKRQVYPSINKDGSINWFNFLTGGSWFRLIILIILIGIIIGFIFEYNSNLKECEKVMSEWNIIKINNSNTSYNPLVESQRFVPNITLEVRE
jgi:hypothetical protein